MDYCGMEMEDNDFKKSEYSIKSKKQLDRAKTDPYNTDNWINMHEILEQKYS